MPTAAPWLAPYDPGVPATLAPYPDRTLVDYVVDHARRSPNSPALLFQGATVTYGELGRLPRAGGCPPTARSIGSATPALPHWRRSGSSAATASACCCPTARSFSSPSSAPGS